MPDKNNFAIIMAGGRGERFWPRSTARRPKQLLQLAGEHPMLTATVLRIAPLIPPERILIVAGAELAPEIAGLLPEFPKENIIAEPCGRNTAPAIALGMAVIRARCPRANVVVLPADHLIEDAPIFRQTLADALALAAHQPVLITIGITPTEPSSGFGYMEAGAAFPCKTAGTQFYKVARFIEKPDCATAAAYLKAGNFYWNAGMFVWSAAAFEDACRRHHPELLQLAAAANSTSALKKVYPKLQKISVDYAILEKAENIVMARGTFHWNDLGSWSALARHLPADKHGNAALGNLVAVDAHNNIAAGDPETLIALVGVKDLIVAQHGRTVLVCPKARDQEVKRVIAELQRRADGAQWL